MTPKPTPPKTWLSGFCNPSHSPESHRRCHGVHGDTPCKCGCHRAKVLLDHVAAIRRQADTTLGMPLTGIGWDDAVRVAHELKMAKAALGAVEEFVAKYAGEQWPGDWRDEQTVEGVGRAHVYRTKNTSWDVNELVGQVIDAHMEANGGEMPDPMQVVRWVLSAAHVDYFRVRQVENLGIDVNEYRHTTWGIPRLSIKSDEMVGSKAEASS